MYCHFYPTVQVSYMYVLCPLGLKQLNFDFDFDGIFRGDRVRKCTYVSGDVINSLC